MKSQRGVSIAVVLMVLVIIVIIIYAVAAQGIWQLGFINRDKANTAAFYAAEAGINEVLVKYKKGDSTWRSGVGSLSSPCALANGTFYYVTVTDNQNGLTDITASDGTIVPQGMSCFLGTGLFQKTGTDTYRVRKSVAVMVKGTTLGKFPFALASGKDITLKAGTDIYGNVKSSGTINFEAQCDVVSVKGSGNVLASVNINASAILNMEASQSARARGTISDASKIKNATVVPGDTSDETLPFINDGASSAVPPAGRQGLVLPYPDTATLLAPGGYTEHGETEISGDFDLGGGIHYFPKGIHFTSKSTIKGRGTIVVGNSYTGVFESGIGSTNDYYPVNIIAMDGDGTGPGSSLSFKTSTFIAGLVWSYGPVISSANFRVHGTVISYKGEQVISGAHAEFSLTPMEVECPGFEAWMGDGSGTSIVNVVSWQRK